MEPASKRRVAIGTAGVLAFFSATTGMGYYYGRRRSPDWSHPAAVTILLNRNHSWRFVSGPTHVPDPAKDPIELTLRLGDRQYRYRSDEDRVVSEVLPPDEVARLELPRLEDLSDREKFLAATGGLAVPTASILSAAQDHLDSLKGKNFIVVAVSTAIIGAGAAWGYSMGYKPEPEFGSQRFQQALLEPDRWQALARYHRERRTNPSLKPR
jgi:hypothetical protein